MTAPSVFLDAIASRLRTLLGSTVRDVLIHDGPLGVDGKEYKTFHDPCVVVFCRSFKVVEFNDPPTAEMHMAALCIARVQRASQNQRTRGSVAMDIGGLVASHVVRERWASNAVQNAENIDSRNQYVHELADQGMGAWSVTWTQQILLTPAAINEALLPISAIEHTFAMGDENTPDAQSLTTFPEAP